MSLTRRILIHGGLTAVTLAVIGFLLAEFAGSYAASQSIRDDAHDQGSAITNTVAGTLPLTLALGGFLFVLLGELLLALWRKP